MLISFAKTKLSILAPIALLLALGSTTRAPAATNAPPANASADAEAAYTRTIEKRAADIIALLDLKDPAKVSTVRELIVNQYRALRDWHDANDARRRKANGEELNQINASLKTIHDKFIAGLSSELTPEQIDRVKDKMTYGTLEATYRGYCATYPNLSDQDKEAILTYLREARELAMDGGSSEEKHAIFRKYKGRINNYLSARGHPIGNHSPSKSVSAIPKP